MAPRRWSRTLTVEGIQTGDGRVIADRATSWPSLPLPLSWAPEFSLHADLIEVAPQIGIIDSIERRDDGQIWGTGLIDDGQEWGAELIRRMDAGLAAGGSRQFVSIDPDDVAYQILLMNEDDEEEVLYASASLSVPPGLTFTQLTRDRLLAPWRALTAAAGDPDPRGPDSDDEGLLLFEDSLDSLIVRFTRMRIRGTTAVAQSAFDDAWIELDAESAQTASVVPTGSLRVTRLDQNGTPQPPTFSFNINTGVRAPARPSVEVFAREPGEPDGSINFDDYAFNGYVATWDTCHTGYTDRCVPPPHEPDYAPFRHGSIECENGERIATGAFTWGIPHAELDLDMLAAFEHYANARHGFGDAVVGANRWGIWHAGALRPGVTDDDVRILSALSMSGDWRFDPRARMLRMIASLAVNHPGYPVPRSLTASADARRALYVSPSTEARLDGDRIVSLVAAGMVRPGVMHGQLESTCGCQDGTGAALTRIERKLQVLDARTRHLGSAAADDAIARIQRANSSAV